MDGSNGNNPSNGGGGGAASNAPTQQPRTPPRPGDSSRAVRAELEAQLRAKVEKQRHYWPLVKQQVERVFGDTQPAWYARLRLFTPAMYAAAAGNRVLGLSMQKDRLLSDAEARALTEHAARSSDRLALIDWGLTGVAAYFTWRGRRTLRFPMWTPQVVPPPPGSYLRMAMWHGARYVAYSAALTVTVKAPLMSLNLMREARQTIADERLRGVLDGQDSAAGEWGKAGAAWDSDISSYRASAGGEDAQQQRQRQSIQEAAQSGWNTSKQTEQSPPLPPQQQQQQQQQPRQYGQSAQSQGNAGWGSSYSQSPSSSSSSAGWGSDDFDDASPVAASAQNSSRSSNSAAGSTWERLRQHARSDPQQRQQQQQQQVQPQVQQQHWGDAGDGADRAAQEKAQRDFDRLVERDRQGRSSR